MTTQTKDLNMISGGVRSYVNVSQYDVGSEIKFALYNNSSAFTPPAGTTVRVEGRKPDGNGFSYSASLSDNVVTVTVTDQMTVLSGEVLCELRLTKDSVDIGTANFILAVEEAPINSDIPISDTEIPAIIELARQEQYTAEAWAKGTRNGEPVSSSDPTYHNNSKYWADQAQGGIREAVEEKTTTTGVFETVTGGKLESCIVAFEPVQSGSGDPSPENVRPITGHTQVEVTNVGKNRLPMTVSGIKSANTSGTWNGNTYTYNNVTFTILTDNNNNVTGIKINGTASANIYFYLDLAVTHLQNGSYILSGGLSNYLSVVLRQYNQGGSAINTYSATSPVSFTLTRQTNDYLRSYFFIASGVAFNNNVFTPMIRLATETNATFEPYQGQDVTDALGDTYYDGTLDVVSGKLTINQVGVDMGTLDWSYSSTYKRFSASGIAKATNHSEIANILSPIYKTVSWNTESSDTSVDCLIAVNNSGSIGVRNLTYTTKETFTDAMDGVLLVYELPTPTEIQLTPQQINTLINKNHLDVPLTGQSLTSAVYREMFTWSDILDAINAAVNA